MKKNAGWIIALSLVACTLMYIVEQEVGVTYAVKTMTKIVVFIAIPILYAVFIKRTGLQTGANTRKYEHDRLLLSVSLGFLSFIGILFAYYLLQRFIDLEGIAAKLQTDLGITPQLFIFVALYITFGNSLLEEFFFRGFVFLELYKEGYRTTAYVLSSVLFGLYHIAIFQGWFSLPLMVLALAGLISIAFVFNWLDAKSGTFINSWIVHVFADIAIILIGFRMFGIL